MTKNGWHLSPQRKVLFTHTHTLFYTTMLRGIKTSIDINCSFINVSVKVSLTYSYSLPHFRVLTPLSSIPISLFSTI